MLGWLLGCGEGKRLASWAAGSAVELQGGKREAGRRQDDVGTGSCTSELTSVTATSGIGYIYKPCSTCQTHTPSHHCCLLLLLAASSPAGIVLNALLNRSWNRELGSVLQRRYVTTNHFDVDSFLSVWCYINRQAAVEHEAGGWGALCVVEQAGIV